MTTDELIAQIARAARNGSWTDVQRHLGQLKTMMSEHGRPISSPNAYRLVEALSDIAPMALRGPDPYALVNEIAENAAKKPPNIAAMRTAWDSLYALLASHNTDIASADVHKVLETFRNLRAFDLVTKMADRALMREAGDAPVRNIYAQALIDTGQTFAAVEMLKSVLALPGLTRDQSADAKGLLGRANQQIYVDNVKSSNAPLATRQRFAPYLKRAIEDYASAYDPSKPGDNYWHGMQTVALLNLASEDGQTGMPNPIGLPPEDIARKIIAALAARGENDPDPYVAGTIGQCYLVLKDYDNAAKYFRLFVEHPKLEDFMITGTVRQIEEVWRIKPNTSGAGALLAMLKAAQIHRPEGKFTLPNAQLGKLRELAGSQHTESMVPGGDFVKLQELQVVVRRASGVVAVMDPSGSTKGTGFLFKGRELSPLFDDAIYLITNAHVMTDPKEACAEPGTLDPATVRLRLEALDLDLQCAPVAFWQSSVARHDATIVKITSPIGDAAPLPFVTDDSHLDVENVAERRTGTHVSVIGHPQGGALSLSIVSNSLSGANGLLIDMGARRKDEDDPVYLHYRAPTEPGNSGSPVFETGKWNVIGLHHMGFDQFDGRPKLNGQPGTNHANEGICIKSIRRALTKDKAPQKPTGGFFKKKG